MCETEKYSKGTKPAWVYIELATFVTIWWGREWGGYSADGEGGTDTFGQGFLIGWGGCALASRRHQMEDQGFLGEEHFLLFSSGSKVEKVHK